MSDTLRIKRRPLGGAAGPPSSLAIGELAYNEQDGTLYIGRSNSTVVPISTAAAGSTGPTGPTGSGATGPSGPLGGPGPTGPTGPIGSTGSAGGVGPIGPAGPAGATGPTGSAGFVGPTGPAGSAGAAGVTGPTGSAGATGAGATGSVGATGPGYLATSTTNVPIQTGSVTVTTQTGLAYQVGARARLSVDANNWMEGPVTAYNPATGSLTVNVDYTSALAAIVPVTSGGYINKFRNPGMDVAQRGVGPTATNNTYTLDGWLLTTSGVSTNWSQVYNANLSGNALRINCVSGLTGLDLQHRIESSFAVQLLKNNKTAQPVTAQYTIYNNSGATLTPQLLAIYPTARDNYASYTTDIAAVNLQSIPNGTIGVVAYTFVPSVQCQLGYDPILRFAGQLNAASGYVDISYADIRATPSAQLGLNNSPPQPEIRPIHEELVFCQRYYQTLGNNNCIDGGYFPGAAQRYWTIPFHVTMRATPTVTYVSWAYANCGPVSTWGVNADILCPTMAISAAAQYWAQGMVTLNAEL